MSLIYILDILIYGVLLFSAYIALNKIFVRANIITFLIPIFVVKAISSFYGLNNVAMLADVFLVGLLITVIISNEEKVKKILRRKRVKKKFSTSTESEKRILYETINDTVNVLSSEKIGGIMTFERNNSLQEYIKTGVKVDAPITAELLTTIFYPGTTLHDGAVIIRGNTIEAASVYFTPTIKALRGKFGARHRASLGISEVSDAITVVVSEETGRISIAMDGELLAVSRENFILTFKELMESEV